MMHIYPSSLVDTGSYSHFPSAKFADGLFGVFFKNGPQHDSGKYDGVATPQQFSGAGPFVLDGVYAVGFPAKTQIELTFSESETASISIDYELDGISDTIVVAGGGPGTVFSVEADKVTAASMNGATNGEIAIGLKMVPQNACYRYSEDGCKTWSERLAVFDGVSDVTNYYYIVQGLLKSGSRIAVCNDIDIETGSRTVVFKKSLDGKVWDASPTVAAITGDLPTTACLFGDIETAPSGRLVAGAYDGNEMFCLTSDDEGENWISKKFLTDGASQFSETTLAILDESTYVFMTRADNVNSSVRQHITTDGALTFTDQGETNMPISGGYKSHDLAVLYVNGEQIVVLTYMCRNAGTPPPNPETICMRWVRASDIRETSTRWSNEIVLVGGLADLSGYPSLPVDHATGVGCLFYGKETEFFHGAEIRTKRVDVVSTIEQNMRVPMASVTVAAGSVVKTPPMPAGCIGTGSISYASGKYSANFVWETIGATHECRFVAERDIGGKLELLNGYLDGTETAGHVYFGIDPDGCLNVSNQTTSAGAVTIEISHHRRL